MPLLQRDHLLEKVFFREGAGPGPTSSALMSDFLSILRGNIKFPFGFYQAIKGKM